MFVIISPAKKLLSIAQPFEGETTLPSFIQYAMDLVQLMKLKSVAEIARLMDLSQDLALLNYNRYLHFNLTEMPVDKSYPALFLFQGDVYQGLAAKSWNQRDIKYAQSHLGILSGIYGLLKPMDRIQPYRLEMGVRLENPKGNNLYEFWRELITQTLNEQLASDDNPVLINLASTEYFKVIDRAKINYPIVTINFYEHKNNEIKMIGIYAKKARGLMAKYIMNNQINCYEELKEFNDLGYVFNRNTSSEEHMDFVRTH